MESHSKEYQCNICGSYNIIPPPNKCHRELIGCISCNSCARFRGVIFALQKYLGLDISIPLSKHNEIKNIIGIGMSDDRRYASELERVFTYTNTYFHKDPVLDITKGIYGEPYSYDFVICSEVLEHVVSPVNASLENLHKMVKKDGLLILSVPYLEGYDTIEHFPHLNKFIVENINNKYELHNVRKNGSLEIFKDLIFHGGPGSTFEMRVFGEVDLMNRLRYVGFKDIEELKPELPEIGYIWGYHCENILHSSRKLKSHILVARGTGPT